MTADIILARPHPFLVDQMTQVLQAAGFTPHRLKSSEDFEVSAPKSPPDAVISSAIRADSPLSLTEAFRLFRGRHPTIPLVFTALAGFGAVARSLRTERRLPAQVEIAGPTASLAKQSGIGTGNLVLLLNQAD